MPLSRLARTRTVGDVDSRQRRALADRLAEHQGGVVSRRRLREQGISCDHVRNEVAAGRWQRVGRQTVAVHRGALPDLARWWAALWETGERIAVLDGVAALLASGLVGYSEATIHVSVRHSHDVRPQTGVAVHKLIRRQPGETAPSGIPRTRPAVAAVRAAGWARSDRQAALILMMTAQQRLVSPGALLEAVGTVLGRKRRRFIQDVVADIECGVQSLGELDFARLCRARGLPEPARQVVRHGPSGRIYLDVRWDQFRLVVEIDGVQHRRGLAVSLDNLGRNAVSLQRDTVLRIDVVGLRLWEDAFLAQVAQGLARSRLDGGGPPRPGAA